MQGLIWDLSKNALVTQEEEEQRFASKHAQWSQLRRCKSSFSMTQSYPFRPPLKQQQFPDHQGLVHFVQKALQGFFAAAPFLFCQALRKSQRGRKVTHKKILGN